MRFAHTSIAAKNWRSLSEFYIKVFDCKIKPPERKLSGAWLDRATGLENAVLEGVHLLLPGHGDNGPTLEIFSYQKMHDCNPIMASHVGIGISSRDRVNIISRKKLLPIRLFLGLKKTI